MTISRFVSVCGALLFSAAAIDLSAQQAPAPPAGDRAPQRTGVRGDTERGRYLVEQVVMCGECHSSRDQAGNIVAGTRFKGGPMPFQAPWPADWPNAFPRIAGLPGYTDEQATRLLTQGAIKRDGTPLRRPMPPFRMNAQDAADVIAYLRSL